MRDLIKKSLCSNALTTKFRRWVGPIPGFADDAWPAYCEPLGQAHDAIPIGDAFDAEGPNGPKDNLLALAGFLKVPDENDEPTVERDYVAIGISVRRVLNGVPNSLPALVRLGKRVFGSVWEEIGVFEVPETPRDLTVMIDWYGKAGTIGLEPVPGEWSKVPGQYFFELQAHGARRPVPCKVEDVRLTSKDVENVIRSTANLQSARDMERLAQFEMNLPKKRR